MTGSRAGRAAACACRRTRVRRRCRAWGRGPWLRCRPRRLYSWYRLWKGWEGVLSDSGNYRGQPMISLERCYNIFDVRDAAQRRLPKGIFEYIDKGTEDGISLAENRAAFQRIKLRTRFLNDWSKRDLGTEIFGKRTNLPLAIAPPGSSGLVWY